MGTPKYPTKEEILEAIQAGVITYEELQKLAEAPSLDERSDAEMMHLLLCNWQHVDELTGRFGQCCFYAEGLLEYPWSRAYHKYWIGRIRTYMSECKLTLDQVSDELHLIAKLSDLIRKLGHYPHLLEDYVHNMNKVNKIEVSKTGGPQ